MLTTHSKTSLLMIEFEDMSFESYFDTQINSKLSYFFFQDSQDILLNLHRQALVDDS